MNDPEWPVARECGCLRPCFCDIFEDLEDLELFEREEPEPDLAHEHEHERERERELARDPHAELTRVASLIEQLRSLAKGARQ